MPNVVTTTFQNGQTLRFVGNTPQTMFVGWQSIVCQCLGIVSNLLIDGALDASTPNVVLDATTGPVNIVQAGFLVSGLEIPTGTTVLTSDDAGNLTLSNTPTQTRTSALSFTDPAANTAVRLAWQTEGTPAWVIGQDICSIECVELDNLYDKAVDEQLSYSNTQEIFESTRIYTRVWEIRCIFRGPNSFDHARLVRTVMRLDLGDTLTQTYAQGAIVSAIDAPLRTPELANGQWWEVTTLKLQMYEQCLEQINYNPVNTVPVQIYNPNTGQPNQRDPIKLEITGVPID